MSYHLKLGCRYWCELDSAAESVIPALNEAAIANTQRAIDQIPGLLEAALAAERTRFSNTTRGFDDQEQGQRKTYGTSSDTNQLNYDSNYMDSIRAGIGGLGNLMSILRGTGAAGGTAESRVSDTVGGVTSAVRTSGVAAVLLLVAISFARVANTSTVTTPSAFGVTSKV